MNRRQERALLHPLENATDLAALRPLTTQRTHRTGVTIRVILAVDR